MVLAHLPGFIRFKLTPQFCPLVSAPQYEFVQRPHGVTLRRFGQPVCVLGLDAVNPHRAVLRAVRGASVVNPFASDAHRIAAIATLGLQQPSFLLRRRARRTKTGSGANGAIRSPMLAAELAEGRQWAS